MPDKSKKSGFATPQILENANQGKDAPRSAKPRNQEIGLKAFWKAQENRGRSLVRVTKDQETTKRKKAKQTEPFQG